MHGGNLRWAQETYGRDSFIDLSANINPFGPTVKLWESLKESLPEITHYPDPESKGLKAVVAEKLKIGSEQIIVGNGAGELIYTIIKALNPHKVVIPLPAFSEYIRAARTVKADISYLELGSSGWESLGEINSREASENFLRSWREHLRGCDLLFLCSPHNPTGSILSRDHFKLIMQIAREISCKIVFDESFVDFLPDPIRWSARSELVHHTNLIVLYSMTKFFSLPGLRLGLALAQAQLIGHFEQYRDPWSVNTLAEKAGIISLQDESFPQQVREKLEESKNYFYQRFTEMSFANFRLKPTAVNFALIEVHKGPVAELVAQLGRQGILVRDCSNFEGLNGAFIRVAIKDRVSMESLIKALAEVD